MGVRPVPWRTIDGYRFVRWEQLVLATNSVIGASLPDDRSSDIGVHNLWTYPM